MNNDNIKLSVCITTFNMEDYIARALDSVLKQKTDFEFEIIVSDDCSEDKTVEILRKYEALSTKAFTIITSAKNKGIIENCSLALKAAKGKYIAILDADDVWIKDDKLQKQVDILEKRSDIDFVYTNFRYIDEKGNQGGKGIADDFIPPPKHEFVTYLLNPYISPSVICFRQSLINMDRINIFIEKGFVSQEYALFLDFTKNGLGLYLNECTMCYTVRVGSHSRQPDIKRQIETARNNFDTGSWFIEENPIPDTLESVRAFNFRFKVLLASWASHNFDFVKQYTTNLKIKDFINHNPKATYIYIASKNKWLYKLVKPWVLRKRPPGQ